MNQEIMNKLSDMLVLQEGFSQYPYKDTVGILTIGIGRNLEAKGISKSEAKVLLANDIDETTQELNIHISWFKDLDEVRQCVLIDMAFNMGINGLMAFKHTLDLISKGQYKEAATEMLNSKWAMQVGNRAQKLSEMMRLGTFL